jgi:hypothetical protein
MTTWTFDGTVNVEGIATAAAAVGAATAYVIDLIRRRIEDARGKRRGARGRMMLELVQSKYVEGVPESEIYRYLTSDEAECVALRRQYGIKRHDDRQNTRQDIETHIIQLVFDRLIEIDSPAHFRLWGSKYYEDTENLSERTRRRRARAELREQVGTELIDQLWAQLADPARSKYEFQDTLHALADLGAETPAARINAIIDGMPEDKRTDVRLALANFIAGPP